MTGLSRYRPMVYGMGLFFGTLSVGTCSRTPDEAGSEVESGIPNAEALAAVIAAERGFSARSEEMGSRTAFLENYAEDGIAFQGGLVNGRELVRNSADVPGLIWVPEVAEASRAGDLGYTSGPYLARLESGDTVWGHYHSVWALESDGRWRVVIDLGGPHGPVDLPTDVETPSAPIVTSGRSASDGGDTPLDADAAFGEAYQREGRSSVRSFALARARIYRFGSVPFRGIDAALADQEEHGEALTWTPEGGRTSTSGDLGYTYGTGTVARSETDGEPRAMSYARFWRRDFDGRWRFVVEVVLPHPPTQGEE